MWVRGLKLVDVGTLVCRIMSHPVWVRGLKRLIEEGNTIVPVAPRVGAWIETCKAVPCATETVVAPRVGAWIET